MLSFLLPLPPTLNATYATTSKHKGMYMKDAAESWKKEAMYYIKKNQPKMIPGKVRVGILWLLKRERDIDGGIKILLDSLQDNSIIENDKMVYELKVLKQMKPNEKEGYVVINIQSIDDFENPKIPELGL